MLAVFDVVHDLQVEWQALQKGLPPVLANLYNPYMQVWVQVFEVSVSLGTYNPLKQVRQLLIKDPKQVLHLEWQGLHSQ